MRGTGDGAADQRSAELQSSAVIRLISDFDRAISHVSFAEVTRHALSYMRETMGLTRASVALLANDGKAFSIFDANLDIRGIESGREVPFDGGSLGETVREVRPIYREDIRQCKTANPVDEALIAAGVLSTLTVPLVCGGRCLGTLNAGANAPNGIGEITRSVIDLIAPRLAFAIHASLSQARTVESESRLSDIFDAVGDGIIVADVSDHKLVMVNPAICRMLGRSEADLLAGTIEGLHPPERLEEVLGTFRAMIEGYLANALDVPMLRRDGVIINVDITARHTILDGKPCVVGLFRDATARQQREQEQVQIQKLDSIRSLAAGIAHDFNNLLTGIIGNMNLAESYLDKGSEPADLLTEAQRAAFRATTLTRQLLTFAKGGTPVRKVMDIVPIVKNSAELACRGSNVQCQFEAAKSHILVMGDDGQLTQAIQNLVRNAIDAMPKGGVVRIGLGLQKAGDPMKGREVLIRIADEGVGIEPSNIDRIFLPFFSTKPQGSGLGLAVTYSVVQNHNGRIGVTSEVGKGTVFEIVIPTTETSDSAMTPSVKPLPLGFGRVLVMDDQAVVRQVAGRMLRQAGYETCLVANGEDAIKACREALSQGQRFDAIILDLTVSDGMGGREAAAALLAIDPAANIIVSSGYSEDGVMSDYARHGFKSVLPKPYSAYELVAAVAAVVAMS